MFRRAPLLSYRANRGAGVSFESRRWGGGLLGGQETSPSPLDFLSFSICQGPPLIGERPGIQGLISYLDVSYLEGGGCIVAQGAQHKAMCTQEKAKGRGQAG